MNTEKKITLDLGKLYGFKLLGSAGNKMTSAKIGQKIGEKNPSGGALAAIILDSKIGTKEGIKNN